MATFGTTVRRGLPRKPGGEPWPAAGAVVPVLGVVERAQRDDALVSPVVAAVESAVSAAEPVPLSQPVLAARDAGRLATGEQSRLRRGLPRVPVGEPWPPVLSVVAASVATAGAPAGTAPLSQPVPPVPGAGGLAAGEQSRLRRGLPRVAGGEPWPPAGFAPVPDAPVGNGEATQTADLATREGPSASSDGRAVSVPVVVRDVSVPLAFPRTVFAGAGGRAVPVARPEPNRYGPFTRVQWAGAVVVGGGGVLVAAAMAVFAVRWLLSLGPPQEFLVTYPGEYHLPEGAPVGIPPWLGWQHFFNVFLMVLIIRSGLQVRSEKRPAVFWSPKTNPKRKISLALWFHQSLDILWVVNGVIFVVLLFVTGQWMKIVPTSWEVFPNAVSAALQYVSLDWPTENGWVNYNSLQQLAYFSTVFLAAPLAIITGVRMSGIWPKNAKTLNRIYPVEWARAVHFPVMLYFVVFIAIHVFLVLATGALRNLNHMYASLGSETGTAYADNGTGFWLFTASLVVIAAAWTAARPLVLAPIARLFGTVTGR